MDSQYTDVIAVFDIGRTWKRFHLFDRSLNPIHTEEKIIAEAKDEYGSPCEDIKAIKEWIDGCVRSVAGSPLYHIAALNIAAGEDCLAHLVKALREIAGAAPSGVASFTGKGTVSTSASLLPYLKGSDKPFILASTGTWCTFINPFAGDAAAGDHAATREAFPGQPSVTGENAPVTVDGRQMRSSGFLLGEVHDRNVDMLDDRFGVTGELYKTIKIKHKKILKMQASRRGRVFFRHGIPEGLADTSADLSHFLTYADAYHQMMYDLTDECLGAYGQVTDAGDDTEILYVAGGFAHNDTFVRILAARLPEKRVYASIIEHATALGAALEVYREAFGTDVPPLYLGLKAILLRDE